MKWFLLISIFFLQACFNLPENIRNPPSVDLQPHDVLSDSNKYQNNPVRWGGRIIDVENKTDKTNIQILIYPLNFFGRPQLNQTPLGRFVTVSKQFLDPAVYTKDTAITVSGSLQGTVEKMIGEKKITMPLVATDVYHVWRQYHYRPYNYFPHYGYRHRFYPYYSCRGRYRYYNCY